MSDANNNEDKITAGAVHQVTIDRLQADALSMDMSAAQTVTAGTVVTNASAVGQLQTDKADTQASAIGVLGAEQVHMRASAAGAISAEHVSVVRGIVGVVQGAKIHTQGRTLIGLLLARQVNGTVRPLLDVRGALVLGLVLGLFLRLTTCKDKHSS